MVLAIHHTIQYLEQLMNGKQDILFELINHVEEIKKEHRLLLLRWIQKIHSVNLIVFGLVLIFIVQVFVRFADLGDLQGITFLTFWFLVFFVMFLSESSLITPLRKKLVAGADMTPAELEEFIGKQLFGIVAFLLAVLCLSLFLGPILKALF